MKDFQFKATKKSIPEVYIPNPAPRVWSCINFEKS